MTSITLNQHRVMDVRVNQSRSGVRVLPWVSECSERNPGITSLISRAREAGDRNIALLQGAEILSDVIQGWRDLRSLTLATIWNRYAVG